MHWDAERTGHGVGVHRWDVETKTSGGIHDTERGRVGSGRLGGGRERAAAREGRIAGGGQAGAAEGGLDEVSGQGAEGSGAGGVEGRQQRLRDHVLLLRVGAAVAGHKNVAEVALGPRGDAQAAAAQGRPSIRRCRPIRPLARARARTAAGPPPAAGLHDGVLRDDRPRVAPPVVPVVALAGRLPPRRPQHDLRHPELVVGVLRGRAPVLPEHALVGPAVVGLGQERLQERHQVVAHLRPRGHTGAAPGPEGGGGYWKGLEGGGRLAQGLGIGLCAFGGAHWPLTTAHSDPLWVRTCFGCVNGAPG